MTNWLELAAILEWSVLGVLFISSVWSIAIILDRRRFLNSRDQVAGLNEAKTLISTANWDSLERWAESDPGLIAGTLAVAQHAHAQSGLAPATRAEAVDRAVRSYLTEQRLRLEKGLPLLATLGANAPFIGLFGTVLGIIRAFAALSDSSGAATSVMTGISQALYATAAGLFVAIPAVIAFNHFSNQLRLRLASCESMKDLYLSHALGSVSLTRSRGS